MELICCPGAQRRPSRACTISCNLCQSVCRLKSQHNKYSYVHVALVFRRSTKLTFRVQSANETPSSSVWSSWRQRWGFRQSYHGFVVNFQARVCVLGEKPSGLLLLLRGELLQRAIHSPSWHHRQRQPRWVSQASYASKKQQDKGPRFFFLSSRWSSALSAFVTVVLIMMLGGQRLTVCLCGFRACNLKIKETWFNYSLLLGSENPTSPSSAILAQRACVLAAASVRPLSGPAAGSVDVSPSQTSLWPRRPEWGERLAQRIKSFFDANCTSIEHMVLVITLLVLNYSLI